MTFLSDELHATRCSSRPSCHCLPLDDVDEFWRRGAFSLLWCLSHRVLLTTKNSLGPSELKVSNIAQPFSSIASSRIRLKSTSESSGPSRDSNSSTSTFSLKVLLRSCNTRSVTRTSKSAPPRCAPPPLHYDEYEFCSGVGGIILLLDSGGAFTCELSDLISSCLTVQ